MHVPCPVRLPIALGRLRGTLRCVPERTDALRAFYTVLVVQNSQLHPHRRQPAVLSPSIGAEDIGPSRLHNCGRCLCYIERSHSAERLGIVLSVGLRPSAKEKHPSRKHDNQYVNSIH
jgi:hypothetical protein